MQPRVYTGNEFCFNGPVQFSTDEIAFKDEMNVGCTCAYDVDLKLGRNTRVDLAAGPAIDHPPLRHSGHRLFITAATVKIPVATRAMDGPEGRSAWKDR